MRLRFSSSQNISLLKRENPPARTHTRALTHMLEPFRIPLSPVTSSLFVSLLIKMTVVKLSTRLSVAAAMIGADRLSICLKQSTGGTPDPPTNNTTRRAALREGAAARLSHAAGQRTQNSPRGIHGPAAAFTQHPVSHFPFWFFSLEQSKVSFIQYV